MAMLVISNSNETREACSFQDYLYRETKHRKNILDNVCGVLITYYTLLTRHLI